MCESSSGQPPLREYIRLAASIEDAVARLYDLFGSLFASDVEFSCFWRLAAETERYHAATVRLFELTVPENMKADEEQLPTAMNKMQEFFADLRLSWEQCSARPPSPWEALNLACRVEGDAAEMHGRAQFSFLYPTLADLFARLKEEDTVHRRMFEAARNRMGQTRSVPGPGGEPTQSP